jgi:uncharacterized membrane protein
VTIQTSTHRATSARWVPFALVALGLLPMVTGALRLGELVGGPHIMPVNPRFDALPLPMVVHIVSVIPYALLGAFQFSAGLRRRHPAWHRMAGRVLVVLGMAVAVSGLWMTLGYPRQTGTGELLWVVRLLVGTAMAASVVLGLAAVRRRDFTRHQAWMTRAYALALGAGTQTFTGAVRSAFWGTDVLANDLAMTAGWVINLAVAELVIHRSRSRANRGPARAVAAKVRPT